MDRAQATERELVEAKGKADRLEIFAESSKVALAEAHAATEALTQNQTAAYSAPPTTLATVASLLATALPTSSTTATYPQAMDIGAIGAVSPLPNLSMRGMRAAAPSPLKGLPMPPCFSGEEKGVHALRWLKTVQRYWEFNLQQYPGRETQFALSRLVDKALSWFETSLGLSYPDGIGIPKEAFVTAFRERYVTDHIASSARSDLHAMSQRGMDVLDFNDMFTKAVNMLKNIPGDMGITDSTATGFYLPALTLDIRTRVSLVVPRMHLATLPQLMAAAVDAQKAIDVEKGYDKPRKAPGKPSLHISDVPPVTLSVNVL